MQRRSLIAPLLVAAVAMALRSGGDQHVGDAVQSTGFAALTAAAVEVQPVQAGFRDPLPAAGEQHRKAQIPGGAPEPKAGVPTTNDQHSGPRLDMLRRNEYTCITHR